MPFVVIQVSWSRIVIAFPGIVTGNLEVNQFDPSKVKIEIPQQTNDQQQEETAPPTSARPSPHPEAPANDLQKQFGAPK